MHLILLLLLSLCVYCIIVLDAMQYSMVIPLNIAGDLNVDELLFLDMGHFITVHSMARKQRSSENSAYPKAGPIMILGRDSIPVKAMNRLCE